MIPDNIKQKVEEHKSKGFMVCALPISGVKYIYRSLNRAEYKSIQDLLTKEAEVVKKNATEEEVAAAAAAIKDTGELQLVKIALIYPELTENTPAGVVATLADRIMEASGFGVEVEPEIL
jgi:hypothetical protein